jgi:hypothetical protein
VTKIGNLLRCFGNVERIDERRLTKEVFSDLGGNAARGKPRRTFLDQIGQVLERPGQEYPKLASMYDEFDKSR